MICVALFLHQIHQYHRYHRRWPPALAFESIVSSSLAIDTGISIYHINLLLIWNRPVPEPSRCLNTTVVFDRRTVNQSEWYPTLCWLRIVGKISMRTGCTSNKARWFWNMKKRNRLSCNQWMKSWFWRVTEFTRRRCMDSMMTDIVYRWTCTLWHFPNNLRMEASIEHLGRKFHCSSPTTPTIALRCPHADVT